MVRPMGLFLVIVGLAFVRPLPAAEATSAGGTSGGSPAPATGKAVAARGGGAQPDFDSLIDLITSTVKPTSWDSVGGPGSIAPFETGVAVDAQGLLRKTLTADRSSDLERMRAALARGGEASARRSSALRMVSLSRLERAVQQRLEAGRRPSDTMHVLAGLERIEYVFAYPDSGDVVIAGPAGDWTLGAEGRIVSAATGRPCLRLDDVVVVLRHLLGRGDGRFGCLITPQQAALARVQEFLAESGKRPLKPDQRDQWLEQLRAQLGQQDIEVYGLNPRTRAARIMVEADYRMKLVGMGLEAGVPGVTSYLASIQVGPGEAPPPMGVLRWWFTLAELPVCTSNDRLAFHWQGCSVRVLSENERLAADGKRIHTGKSEELNSRFAASFTMHFDELAAKYPIYAELRNLMDLAIVGAIIKQEDLQHRAGWPMTWFGHPQAYPVEDRPAPTKVETVINHRIINRVHVVAGVSGGVSVNAAAMISAAHQTPDADQSLQRRLNNSQPPAAQGERWWWDP